MSDPLASSSQSKPSYKHIPIRVFNSIDTIPNGLKTQLLTKINQLNDQIDDTDSSKLASNEIANIESLVDILCDTSHYHSSNVHAQLLIGIIKIINWSPNNAFPGFDLARLVAVHPSASKKLSENSNLSNIVIYLSKNLFILFLNSSFVISYFLSNWFSISFNASLTRVFLFICKVSQFPLISFVLGSV